MYGSSYTSAFFTSPIFTGPTSFENFSCPWTGPVRASPARRPSAIQCRDCIMVSLSLLTELPTCGQHYPAIRFSDTSLVWGNECVHGIPESIRGSPAGLCKEKPRPRGKPSRHRDGTSTRSPLLAGARPPRAGGGVEKRERGMVNPIEERSARRGENGEWGDGHGC